MCTQQKEDNARNLDDTMRSFGRARPVPKTNTWRQLGAATHDKAHVSDESERLPSATTPPSRVLAQSIRAWADVCTSWIRANIPPGTSQTCRGYRQFVVTVVEALWYKNEQ